MKEFSAREPKIQSAYAPPAPRLFCKGGEQVVYVFPGFVHEPMLAGGEERRVKEAGRGRG